MTSLQNLTWEQLAARLEDLQQRTGSTGELDPVRLLHELQVHQVELEMQNRELRDAERQLEASRARYVELYDRAPVGYGVLDPRGVVVEMNLTAAALFGVEREAIVGLHFANVAGPRGSRVFFTALSDAAKRGAPSVTVDVEVCRSAQPRILQVTVSPNRSDNGQFLGYWVVMLDVTEPRRATAEREAFERERRARAEADEANRMKDQFLGIVSHELRTPLNAMLGWTQILAARRAEPDLVARGLDVMQRNGQALARLVDDILDVSRIVSGKLQIESRAIQLEDVVRVALDSGRADAASKGIALSERIEAGCGLCGDPMRLQQVVTNLLSNAVKFTPQGGHVVVTLERVEHALRLTVSDDGCGIDEADLPHVFEYFRQADSSTTRAHAGLGLGLAIARHIVEAHGGTIGARSAGRGRGATFTAELPGSPGSSRPRPAVDPSSSASSIAGVRVLCVDDEGDGLEALALALGAAGAVVRTAKTVDEAFALAEKFGPDVVVSDIAMPKRDGYDLVRRLRASPPPLGSTPAIALSAYARREDAEDALRAGFTRHVSKPVDPAALSRAIASVLYRASS